jgi:hypothetical protein
LRAGSALLGIALYGVALRANAATGVRIALTECGSAAQIYGVLGIMSRMRHEGYLWSIAGKRKQKPPEEDHQTMDS